MKKLFVLGLLMTGMANIANASQANRVCFSKAENAVDRQAEPGYYDKDGIQALSCDFAPNGKAVICVVGASKGDGAATDTFRVVLNVPCSRVFRVELTGEE